MTKRTLLWDEALDRIPDAARRSGDVVGNMLDQAIGAVCYFRKKLVNTPLNRDYLWGWTYERICEGRPPGEPDPAEPGIPGNLPGYIKAYLYLPGSKWRTNCPAWVPEYWLSSSSDAVGKRMDTAFSADVNSCGVGQVASLNLAEWADYYLDQAGDVQPVIIYSGGLNLNGTVANTAKPTWKAVNPDGTVPPVPEGDLPDYEPPFDLGGQPRLPGSGGAIKLPDIGIFNLDLSLADELNVSVDVGGITIDTGDNFVGVGQPGKPPSKPRDVSNDDLGDTTNIDRGNGDDDLDPDAEYEAFLIECVERPENVKVQRPSGRAQDVVWTGWYSFKYKGFEGERIPLDRVKVVAFPPDTFDGIAIGSYTGCRHEVTAVRRKK